MTITDIPTDRQNQYLGSPTIRRRIESLLDNEPELFAEPGITAPELCRKKFASYSQGGVRAALDRLVAAGKLRRYMTDGSWVMHYVKVS